MAAAAAIAERTWIPEVAYNRMKVSAACSISRSPFTNLAVSARYITFLRNLGALYSSCDVGTLRHFFSLARSSSDGILMISYIQLSLFLLALNPVYLAQSLNPRLFGHLLSPSSRSPPPPHFSSRPLTRPLSPTYSLTITLHSPGFFVVPFSPVMRAHISLHFSSVPPLFVVACL